MAKRVAVVLRSSFESWRELAAFGSLCRCLRDMEYVIYAQQRCDSNEEVAQASRVLPGRSHPEVEEEESPTYCVIMKVSEHYIIYQSSLMTSRHSLVFLPISPSVKALTVTANHYFHYHKAPGYHQPHRAGSLIDLSKYL